VCYLRLPTERPIGELAVIVGRFWVSEPNLGHNFRSVDTGGCADRGGTPDAEVIALQLSLPSLVAEAMSLDAAAAPSDAATLPTGSGLAVSDLSLVERLTSPTEPQQQQWEQEHAALLTELMQAQSLAHSQLERIRQLEQALDQSLASLYELRLQVIDQQHLEHQLAATEEIANIQQQAIVRLKLQLAEQQALAERLTAAQAQDRDLPTQLVLPETLTQKQQAESQPTGDRTEAQRYQADLEQQLAVLQATLKEQQQRISELESQYLSTRILAGSLEVRLDHAQTRIQELAQNLDDRQTVIEQLEAELRQSHTALQEQQVLVHHLEQTHTPNQPPPSFLNRRDGTATHAKIEALESQIAKHLTTQAMLQHACQELETERDRQQARIVGLENQTADMQEQILRQAQQASEYETAVQHWKDRYLTNQQQLLHLKDQLEQLAPNLPAELVEMLAMLQSMTAETTEPVSPALLASPQSSREAKIDLPEFLMRRRTYKARRST